jgi:succinate dehydrogenase/fumarate reductase flavoprotein subunit
VSESNRQQWDEVRDVVVVGSGAGALTAALLAADGGADVVVVEKAPYIGGITGVSGGDMWIPNNHHLAERGFQDSREEAIAYILRISDGRASDPSLAEVYVDTAPEALNYLEANTGYRSTPQTRLDDYYSPIIDRIPGAKPFTRTVSPMPYPAGTELGELAELVIRGSWLGPEELMIGEMLEGTVGPEELSRRQREGYRAKGGGLISPLFKALVDRGVEVRPSTRARELVLDADRAVIGLVVEGPGGQYRIGTGKGVVLACGGFEWNADMVKAYIGYEVRPIGPGTDEGDGHLMAMEAGAKMGSMSTFWGFGAMYDPNIVGSDGQPQGQLQMGLGPGSILVNRAGRRFMHGGYTYNDFPHGFGTFDQRYPGFPNKGPGWVIFGTTVKDTVQIMSVAPSDRAPDWIPQANTIRELADKIGIDPDTLEETVSNYNKHAPSGEDPEWGDPTQAPVVAGFESGRHAPVVGPPYYAIQQWPATLGTNGGCRIDADGRVLATRGGVIDGLYAAGNTSASVLGSAYLGGGSPIGSSVTFGYRAGRHVARRPSRDV